MGVKYVEKRKYIVTLEREITQIVNLVVLASDEYEARDAAAAFANSKKLPREPMIEIDKYKSYGATRYVGELLDVEA